MQNIVEVYLHEAIPDTRITHARPRKLRHVEIYVNGVFVKEGTESYEAWHYYIGDAWDEAIRRFLALWAKALKISEDEITWYGVS